MLSVIKISAVVLVTSILVGCAGTESIEIKTTPDIERPKLNKQLPVKPNLIPGDFKIITQGTQEDALLENDLYYAMSSEQFDNHLDNLHEILRYTIEIELLIKAYQDFYERVPDSQAVEE